jgi:hypothetical protein
MNQTMHEWELEAEGGLHELESALAAELEGEMEALPELGEFEHELEGEFEQEQFFAALSGLARRAAASPALRRIGAQAARAALRAATSAASEFEGEHELEGEMSAGALLSPVRKVYPDALMEHMAHVASRAESEQEAAEAFLPLVPMLAAKLAPLALRALPSVGKAASKLVPRVMQGVMRVAPQLTRGVGQIARTLHRNPQMRPLMRVVPTIARRTTAQLARQIARGGSITPQAALRALASQTARTLSSPRSVVHAYRRGRRLDRAAHSLVPGAVHPAAARQALARCPSCGR